MADNIQFKIDITILHISNKFIEIWLLANLFFNKLLFSMLYVL